VRASFVIPGRTSLHPEARAHRHTLHPRTSAAAGVATIRGRVPDGRDRVRKGLDAIPARALRAWPGLQVVELEIMGLHEKLDEMRTAEITRLLEYSVSLR
jgi:hypothetical protein